MGLNRPECVLAHESGCLFVPNWSGSGGVSLILANGITHHILQSDRSLSLRPNGISLDPNGNIVLAHLGESRGGVFTLSADGSVRTRVETVNHQPMPPANFVVHDAQGRLWITVSTRVSPRADDYRRNACTGFIAVAEPNETNARIVADGLGYTNEVVLDEHCGKLFVNETFARRLTQFTLHEDATLSEPHTLVNFSAGTYPDGLALACDGSLWVTSILSNRVLVVYNNGEVQLLLEDADTERLTAAENAYENNTLGRSHLDNSLGTHLHNISNLAFAGSDLKTAYLGNLLGTTIPSFESPVAGQAMNHWQAPIEQWLNRYN